MLPDILSTGLRVVFCGTAVSTTSAARGHYYSGRGNKFWHLLHDAGFTPTRLSPVDDITLPDHGLGVTDLVKGVAQSHDRGLDFSATDAFAGRLIEVAPVWVAFNGLRAARETASRLHQRKKDVVLGEASWLIGSSRVFVLPSSSGANATLPFSAKLKWWTQLRELAGFDGSFSDHCRSHPCAHCMTGSASSDGRATPYAALSRGCAQDRLHRRD